MSKKRITLGIIFGGQSAEHEISIKSAKAIFSNLDKKQFSPILIYINKNGLWAIINEKTFLSKRLPTDKGSSFLPWMNTTPNLPTAEIYFPVLHGPNGEDGKIQSLLELAGKPFVGADSFSSALAMDKVASKLIFKSAGLKVGDFLYFDTLNNREINKQILNKLGYPVFVKPCAMGSSVGISKVESSVHLKDALELAFSYDKKIIIEKALNVREIEVSVMGNKKIRVSRPGELIPHNDFYDYNDKYIDGKTTFHIPADLNDKMELKIRQTAEKAFRALFLNGMARVDLFIENGSDQIFVNELNTIPGFTEISMFPKLWQLEGLTFKDLITTLIGYGFEFFKKYKNHQ